MEEEEAKSSPPGDIYMWAMGTSDRPPEMSGNETLEIVRPTYSENVRPKTKTKTRRWTLRMNELIEGFRSLVRESAPEMSGD